LLDTERVFQISGHIDLTQEEFDEHYVPAINKAIDIGGWFVIGDARGADAMAQATYKRKALFEQWCFTCSCSHETTSASQSLEDTPQTRPGTEP